MELDQIDQWTESGKNIGIQIYVAPFQSHQKDLIVRILEGNDKNIVVLYSGINKRVHTEKLGTMKNEKF